MEAPFLKQLDLMCDEAVAIAVAAKTKEFHAVIKKLEEELWEIETRQKQIAELAGTRYKAPISSVAPNTPVKSTIPSVNKKRVPNDRKQISGLVAKGKTPKEIALIIGKSVPAVRAILSRMKN